LVALVTLAAVTLAACAQQEQPQPTPTTVPPTVAPTRNPDPTDAWSQIQEEGKLIAATSADYPPFAYYTDDFQLTGFDVALIQAVGEKLGVEVELRDMAFDGLGDALTVNQVDAAIAAISVTDERAEQVDFSSVYLISEDAVLARADDSIQIDDITDAAGYRIGVQSGSVYQQWVVDALVEPGLIPATNVFLYQRTDQAVEDLANGFIDVVIGDAPVLDVAADTGRFAIVARGLNIQ
jgi:polar amino acid transport system substrate-binding protein